MTDVQFSIRTGGEADREFILKSWLRSHHHSGYGTRRIDPRAYFAHHHPIVERILSAASVSCAVTTEDAGTILGYVVSQGSTLHYCYTKRLFRRYGIATRLLACVPVTLATYSYFCDTDGAHAIARKLPGIVFNPYSIEERHERATEAATEVGR